MLDDESDKSCFICFGHYFLSRLLILDFLYLMSSDKSDSLDDESDNDGSDSGSSSRCYFPLNFENSVDRVSGLGSGIFVPTGVESKCGIFTVIVFIPIGFESKVGRLIKMFWH